VSLWTGQGRDLLHLGMHQELLAVLETLQQEREGKIPG